MGNKGRGHSLGFLGIPNFRSLPLCEVTFPQSQYHFKDEIFMLSRQLREHHWRQIIQ